MQRDLVHGEVAMEGLVKPANIAVDEAGAAPRGTPPEAPSGVVMDMVRLDLLEVAENLDSGIGRLVRHFGVVTAFRLDVGLAGRARPVRVDVRVPNHLSFDRRVGADLIHEYLLEAGFMQLPVALRVAS